MGWTSEHTSAKTQEHRSAVLITYHGWYVGAGRASPMMDELMFRISFSFPRNSEPTWGEWHWTRKCTNNKAKRGILLISSKLKILSILSLLEVPQTHFTPQIHFTVQGVILEIKFDNFTFVNYQISIQWVLLFMQ